MSANSYQPHNHIQVVKADDIKQTGFGWGRSSHHRSSGSHESTQHEVNEAKLSVDIASNQEFSDSNLTKQVQFKSLKHILQGLSRRRSMMNGDCDSPELKQQDSAEELELNILHDSSHDLEKRLTTLYREDEKLRTEETNCLMRELEAELVCLRAKITFREKFDDSHIPFTVLRHASAKSTPELESDRSSESDLDFMVASELVITNEDIRPIGKRLGVSSFIALPSTTLFVPDPCHEQQTQQLENVIAELSEQLAISRTSLSVIKIELGNLGFTDSSTDSCKEILTIIRQSFRQARLEFQELFPGHKIDNVQNDTLLSLILNNTRGILARMEEQVLRIYHQEKAIALYKAEYHGALNKLSESDGNRIHLENTHQQQKKALDLKEREINAIENHVQLFIQRIDEQHTGEVKTSTDRGRFNEVLTLLEQRYAARLQKAREEQKNAISTWKTKAQAQSTAKESAVQESKDKQNTIIELQKTLESYKERVKDVEKTLDTERQNYVLIEKRFQSKTQLSTKLEENLATGTKHTVELRKKLDIAKQALTVQKQQHKSELSMEVTKHRQFEIQLTEVTSQLQDLQKTHKKQGEKMITLDAQLQQSKDHSKMLQERNSSLNSSVTQGVTRIRTLESDMVVAEETRVKMEQQVESVKKQLRSVSETRTNLEKQITVSTSSLSEKIQHLLTQTNTLTMTVEEQASHLKLVEHEYEEERKTSAALRVQIEQIQSNARIMATSFEDARQNMQQVQNEVMKRVMQEITGEQDFVKERFSEVKTQYEDVLTGIDAIKADSIKSEQVRTKHHRVVSTGQVKSSKKITQITQSTQSAQSAQSTQNSHTKQAVASQQSSSSN